MDLLATQAFAQTDASKLGQFLDPIMTHIVNPLVMLLFAIGLLVFAYGIFEMIWQGGEAAAHEKGRNHMLGGLIGMFVMLSAWGLIYLVSNTIKGL